MWESLVFGRVLILAHPWNRHIVNNSINAPSESFFVTNCLQIGSWHKRCSYVVMSWKVKAVTTVCLCQWSSPVNPMKRLLSCSWSPVIPWSSLENTLGHMTCWSPLQSSLLPFFLFIRFTLLPHRRAPCCTVIVIALLGQFPPRVIIIFLSLHVLPPVSQNSSEARSLSRNLSCINSKENVLGRNPPHCYCLISLSPL